jgi:hypothetical protein
MKCSIRRNGHLPAWIVSAALIVTAGCGARAGDVTGTVTYQGKTVASGTVIIAGSDSLTYYGTIENDGSYRVAKVPIGLARLTVVSPGPVDADLAGAKPPANTKLPIRREAPRFRGDPAKWFPIPKELGDFATSGLTVSVNGGVTQHDLLLK